MIYFVVLVFALILPSLQAMEKKEDDKPHCVLISNQLEYTENDKIGTQVKSLMINNMSLPNAQSLPFLHADCFQFSARYTFCKPANRATGRKFHSVRYSSTQSSNLAVNKRTQNVTITGCIIDRATQAKPHDFVIKALLAVESPTVPLKWKKIVMCNHLRDCETFSGRFYYNPSLEQFLRNECEITVNGTHIPHGQEKDVYVPCYTDVAELIAGALIVQFRKADLKKTYKTAIFSLKSHDIRSVKLTNCHIKGSDFTPAFSKDADLLAEDNYLNEC